MCEIISTGVWAVFKSINGTVRFIYLATGALKHREVRVGENIYGKGETEKDPFSAEIVPNIFFCIFFRKVPQK